MANLCRVPQLVHHIRAGGLLLRTASGAMTTAAGSAVQDRIDSLVKSSKVVVFMKGVPEAPRCGFSNAIVQILRMHDVPYESRDVLEDESLRQGIKEFTNWPTIPQVFINGEFVGGTDIVLQMHQSGELIEELKKVGIRSALLGKDEPGSSGESKK